MINYRYLPMLGSSPTSTDGAMPENSPDTKHLMYSPEELRVSQLGHNVGISSLAGGDPFLGPSPHTRRSSGLSNAETFRLQEPPPLPVRNSAETVTPNRPAQAGWFPANMATPTSEPYARVNPIVGRTPTSFSTPGAPDHEGSMSLPPFCSSESDFESRSRAFAIEDIPRGFPPVAIAIFFNRREFASLRGPVLSALPTDGKIFVQFSDSRDAARAREKVRVLHQNWHIVPLTAREFASQTTGFKPDQVSDFEGQIQLKITDEHDHDHAETMTTVRLVTSKIGDIKVFYPLPVDMASSREFIIEYFDVRDAENAAMALDNNRVEGWHFQVKLRRPDVEASCRSLIQLMENTTDDVGSTSTAFEVSPTGRSKIPKGERAELADWVLSSAPRSLARVERNDRSRNKDDKFRSQNHVDLDRIRRGQDVRTTIMLRNIPNKINQTMLKAILDETSFAKYDFMYLRIDFANNCNVGYAFINFEDPIDIIDFAEARAGKTWNCFNSDKVAEISYATIQGKDCLISRFRNSSVMLEDPMFRPKIFRTGTGPLAGTEEEFPGPDNMARMRRSVENAEHVGLFAPRMSREEKRRRHSAANASRAPASHQRSPSERQVDRNNSASQQSPTPKSSYPRERRLITDQDN